jgi:hypothetical protein
MANKYRQLTPIPGKFYVSEGWKAGNSGTDGIRSQHDHDNHLAEMVLAGPYDTRNEAEHWNSHNANGHANVWQRS